MLKQTEGSVAIAEGVAKCLPEVVCAYPITPQTHIVEALAVLVREGEVGNCEYINVESEFAALSVCIGASAAGARAYTATSSQGLLYMAEAVYNASGMGLPIVMTVGNRAIGAPINIWNDHSDSMALREAGWIQLHAETNQEAVDLHIQAFKLAEALNTPVMVCVDGFILTHAYEQIDIPEKTLVDAFLPPFEPTQVLDTQHPISFGAMVGPEAFTEVKFLAHQKQLDALPVIENLSAEFEDIFEREAGGLVAGYKLDNAETVIVALGSVLGTIKDIVDEMIEEGISIGVLKIGCYRPFPVDAVKHALRDAKRIIVVEKSFIVGGTAPVTGDIIQAIRPSEVEIKTIVCGLGGRPIFKASLNEAFHHGVLEQLDDISFLDIKQDIVNEEIQKQRQTYRNNPVYG